MELIKFISCCSYRVAIPHHLHLLACLQLTSEELPDSKIIITVLF